MEVTVGRLIKMLAGCEDDRVVVLARDPEGNGYSPLDELCEAFYRPENTYSGELVDEDEDVVEPTDKPCVVLWPTN